MRHSSCQRVRRTGSDPGRHRTAAQTRAINGCADASCQQLKVASIPPSQIASVNAVVAVEATCRRNYCADVDSVVNCPLRRGQLQRLQMRSAVRHSERSGTHRRAHLTLGPSQRPIDLLPVVRLQHPSHRQLVPPTSASSCDASRTLNVSAPKAWTRSRHTSRCAAHWSAAAARMSGGSNAASGNRSSSLHAANGRGEHYTSTFGDGAKQIPGNVECRMSRLGDYRTTAAPTACKQARRCFDQLRSSVFHVAHRQGAEIPAAPLARPVAQATAAPVTTGSSSKNQRQRDLGKDEDAEQNGHGFMASQLAKSETQYRDNGRTAPAMFLTRNPQLISR